MCFQWGVLGRSEYSLIKGCWLGWNAVFHVPWRLSQVLQLYRARLSDAPYVPLNNIFHWYSYFDLKHMHDAAPSVATTIEVCIPSHALADVSTLILFSPGVISQQRSEASDSAGGVRQPTVSWPESQRKVGSPWERTRKGSGSSRTAVKL